MRVLVMVRADQESESGALPDEAILTAMTSYNEQLARAGVLLAGEGLKPSSDGVRVRFSGERTAVVNGPFAARELIAGYWLLRVGAMAEALEWAKRCPNPTGGEFELEIRPVVEAEDFGAEATPELLEREEKLRAQTEQHPR